MNNPPAFPLIGHTFVNEGMSLRDYFAAQCIVGQKWTGDEAFNEKMAKGAYMVADAMLAERQKGAA